MNYQPISKNTIVVGVNEGHDGGAAIVVDGIVRCAISEEKLNRKKYSPGYLNSFFYCLNALNLKVKDISLIVFSNYGKRLPEHYQGMLKSLGIPPKKFITADHHLSHAFGAYFLSPFDEALILVIDGQGNGNDTESYYIGEGQRIEKIGGNSPNQVPAKGIGRTYEAFTNFLGWIDQEAGKTMALAAYGDASKISIPLFRLKGLKVIGALDYKYERGVIEFAKRYSLDFGPSYSRGNNPKSIDVAAYVQKEVERILIELITKLVENTGKRKLCYAGGVALNCVANYKLFQKRIVDDIFILPAASDKGQAIGNALYGFYKLEGYIPRQPLRNDYFGREYSEKEILSVLKGEKVYIEKHIPTQRQFLFERQNSIPKTAAQLLADGKIIGWFQGGSELGPRALGHRSILCDPRNIKLKNQLNEKIKHREWFRPFAPSCLLEKTPEYFAYDNSFPYMLFALPVKSDKKTKIPAVIHINGTSRIQTVTKEDNDIFFDLIKEFYNITGIPMILNTSFNSQEPIVETPEHALSTFLKTEMDYLAINDFLVWKKK
ncbi:hypothetical protein J7K42_01750 [bacterium]|nr:hypothetical protein [bacterium]